MEVIEIEYINDFLSIEIAVRLLIGLIDFTTCYVITDPEIVIYMILLIYFSLLIHLFIFRYLIGYSSDIHLLLGFSLHLRLIYMLY